MERFNFKKAVDVSPTAIAKSSSLVFKGLIPFILLALISWMCYNALNKPTQTIIARKGSKVTVVQQNKRFLIPFIEIGAEQRSSSKLATFLRGGVRWEW